MAAGMRSALRLALLLLLCMALAAQAAAGPLPRQSEENTAPGRAGRDPELQRAKRFLHLGRLLGGQPGAGHHSGQGARMGFQAPLYKPYNNFFQPESTNIQPNSHNFQPSLINIQPVHYYSQPNGPRHQQRGCK